ncbi:OsmC family protein [Salipiger mangrovisoli]|uniref:OsmC family protein n=1 Tax=Salipiger mangrovisoli TaxID=2865933 RepID=A0ABR9X1A6_9RHOB|nr:OsmC family protein [Salipiger mangrovisoli]MBE9637291.1 OsmC family protein [Salipiger mangrovisoli]
MTHPTETLANRHTREAQARVVSVFTKRPEAAQSVNLGTAAVTDGLTCTYDQDGQRIVLDMPKPVGGSGAGPSPGFFGRAALSGCVAIGIKMTAAREGLHLDAVQVDIEQHWDDRGLFALAGTPAGPLDTRLTISVASPEPAAKVQAMVSRALDSDPWFLAFRDAQSLRTEVTCTEAAR